MLNCVQCGEEIPQIRLRSDLDGLLRRVGIREIMTWIVRLWAPWGGSAIDQPTPTTTLNADQALGAKIRSVSGFLQSL